MRDQHRNIQILDRIIGDQEPEDQAVLDAIAEARRYAAKPIPPEQTDVDRHRCLA